MSEYTGKRIVPKPCGFWEKLYSYEALSVVLYKETGDSYISRKAVPEGIEISDTEYWMLCSEFSAQYAKVLSAIEELQNTTETLKEQVAANVSASTDSDADYAAEVVDARTGADGETYESLGAAIRGVDNKKQDAYLDVTGELTSGITINTARKGQTQTFANCWTTDFIPVNGNFMKVYYTGKIYNWIGVAGYDDEGTFITSIFDLTDESTSRAYTNLELDIPDGVTQIRASSYTNSNLKIIVQVDSEKLWEYLTNAHLRIDDAEDAIGEVADDLEETVSDGSITIGHLANYSGSFLSAFMNDRGGRLAVGKNIIGGIPLAEADYEKGILYGEVTEDKTISGNSGLTVTFTGVANCPDTFSYTALMTGYGETFTLYTNAWTENYSKLLSPNNLSLEDGVEKTFTVSGIREKLYAAGYDDTSVIKFLIWNHTTGVTLPAGTTLILSNFVWSFTDDVYPLVENSVTEEKIVDGAVSENKLADNSISESKIIDGSVTENKLAEGSVTEDKIADGSVTRKKLADGAVMYQDITGSAEDIEIAVTSGWTGSFASKIGSTLLVDYDEESDAVTITVGADATSKNGGLVWKFDQSLLDYTKMLYVEFDLTAYNSDASYATVFFWEKNSEGTTKYYAFKRLTESLVGTTVTIQYDMAYRAVYADMTECVGIIINHATTTEGSSFTISNLRVYREGIWGGVSTYADDLPTFLKNIDSAVTKVQENINSLEVAETQLSDISIVGPSGDKYVFSINDTGALTALPVVPDNILFMGNSLLSGFGTFGMAAQDSDHDYYHYITTYLTDTLGIDLTAVKLASSGFEGQTDADTAAAWVETNVLPKLSSDTKLVLIQLSDNVNTTEKLACFTDSCFAMTSYIRKNAPNARVAWVAAWYYSSAKQEIVKAACENTGSVFIDISDLKVEANQNVVGNTYINSSGVETEITSSGVASHPNSRGMLAIANRILYKLGITDTEEAITDDTLDM